MKIHLPNYIQDTNWKKIVNEAFNSIQDLNESIILAIDTCHHEKNSLLTKNKDRGIYIAPSQTKSLEDLPTRIITAISNSSNMHLIWLSYSTYIKDDIFFAWVLNHEMGHFLQNIGIRPPPDLRQKIKDLRRLPEFIWLPSTIMTPKEIDADLAALNFCYNYFGKTKTENYIYANGIERCPFSQYYPFLCSLIISGT